MKSDYRKVVSAALATGDWVDEGCNGRDHHVIRHKSGRAVVFPSSPSDVNGIRNLAKDIERVSGVAVWNRGSSRRPSRKSFRGSGFHMLSTVSERETGSRVAELVTAWHANDRALQEIERMPEPSRRDICNARSHLGQLSEIAGQLKALHQPVPVREVFA